MIDLLKRIGKKCTGCGACYNICPVHAIEMDKNPQGFIYPRINKDKCINCKKCENICPKIHPYLENSDNPKCYAARAQDDVRMMSSSGGMFTVIAHWILENHGVVCGAAMEADFSVHHICVENENGLSKLRKSKYVQSNTENIYQEILLYLKEGRTVLFTGCPCQVAAARNYFHEHKNNIYYVDILCHGVPSVQMWQDYIKENFDVSKIKNIDFRNKRNGWRSDQLWIEWTDGSSSVISCAESAFEEGFQRNISLRDGCEECEFSGLKRQGDLTIGDFWRVGEYNEKLNDGKGTSVVLVNNKKGEFILEQIKAQLFDLKEMPIETAKHNRIKISCPSHPQKSRFKLLYPGHSFSTAVMQCRHSLYDIGLVGIYSARNYGGQLTQYALYSALTNMGYSVLMIERPLDSRIPPHRKGAYLFSKDPYPKYAKSKFFPNIAEMKFLNLQCKCFVTGSDQMFNNNLYNDCGKFMTLNFVMDNHRKIAYAASWGHDRIWGEEVDRASESYFLRKFDYFSVREDSAVELAQREFGVNATWVLDPVFLCPMEYYKKLMKIGEKTLPQKPYLLAYVLDPDAEKEAILKKYAQEKHLSVHAISDAKFSKQKVEKWWSINTSFGVKMEEWIAYIVNSDFFITDSFHGMCIAILFHKPFFVLVNKVRGETRFTSLLNLLGLTERLVYSIDELQEKMRYIKSIDYNKVEEILTQERKKSRTWLIEALENNKNVRKPLSEFDILDSRCDDISKHFDSKFNELSKKIEELEKRENIRKKKRSVIILKDKLNKFQRCLKENGILYTIKRVKTYLNKKI